MSSPLIAAITAIAIACSAAPEVTPEPVSTEDVVVTPEAEMPTVAPAIPTAVPTPQPNYRGMRTSLVIPLGALIVAVRNNNGPQSAAFLAQFNDAAESVLPVIASDTSKPGNALHSAIVNVRSHPGNLAALEQDRLSLLRDIP